MKFNSTSSILKFTTFVFVVLLISTIFSQNAFATNVGGYVFKSISSKVLLNFFANYNYFSRDLPFRYIHQIEALDEVRSELVENKKLQDISFLVTMPHPFSPFPEHTEISLKDECSTDPGDSSGRRHTPIGPCYQIYIIEEPTHSNLLTLTLALQGLTSENSKIEVQDIQKLKDELSNELASFQNIIQYFDPIWAPNSESVLYTVWQDGKIHFELLEPVTKQAHSLEVLSDYMIIRPIWSPDSQYIAYASINEIKIFDTQTSTHRYISLESLFSGSNNETLLTFNDIAGQLTFAQDTNLFDSYDIYAYYLSQENLTVVSQDDARPSWGETLDSENYISQEQVESPNGQWIAIASELEIQSPAVTPPSDIAQPLEPPPSNKISLATFIIIIGISVLLIVAIILVCIYLRKRKVASSESLDGVSSDPENLEEQKNQEDQ